MKRISGKSLVVQIVIFIIIAISISSVFAEENSINSRPKISLSKTEFYTDESINVLIDSFGADLSKIDLVLSNIDTTYKYFGVSSNEIIIDKKPEGNYTLLLEDRTQVFDSVEITIRKSEKKIVNKPVQTSELELSTDKKVYDLNEAVIITSKIIGVSTNIEIVSKDATFKFLGLNEENVSFTPKFPGVYEVRLIEGQNILSRIEFLVINPMQEKNSIIDSQNISIQEIFQEKEINVTDNLLKIHNSKGQVQFMNRKKMNNDSSNMSDDEIIFNGNVKKLRFRNLTTKNPRIGIEEFKSTVEIEGKMSLSAYAIDPQNLNFTDAVMTVTAIGTELYKCVDWSFAEQSCIGTWKKVMDLTPGIDYDITINATDPGFIETGLATINSKKPIYHANETAELLIAVLDYGGYMVDNASVTVQIITPDNTTYNFYSPNDILNLSKGIYGLNFSNTTLVGNYSVNVYAQSSDLVNFSMFSNFKVLDYYEFDILRDAPISIDPWNGEFNSTISVNSFIDETTNNLSNITLIEKVPLEFNITDNGGALLSSTSTEQQLTWSNISPNSSFMYKIAAPLISPELYKLGPALIQYVINTQSNTFWEARPWYIASDPTIQVNATVCDEMLSSAAGGNWNYATPCNRPSNLTQNDGVTEFQQLTATNNLRYCGVRTGYTQSLSKCSNITSVYVCYKFWKRSAGGTCTSWGVGVSSTGIAGTYELIPGSNATCPTSQPAANCTDVTTLGTLSWTCNSFNSGNAYARTSLQVQNYPSGFCDEDLLIFNVTYQTDDYPPNFSNIAQNRTYPYMNDSINFTVTIQDNQTNISFWIFSIYNGSTWSNVSNGTGSGLSYNASTARNINYPVGTNVCYKWYANDSVNNWNESVQTCFIVARQVFFYNNITNLSAPILRNSSAQFNITVNASLNISTWRFEWNATGVWVNVSNGTFGSGVNSSELSVDLQLNIPWGTNVCYRWYANDSQNVWNSSITNCFIMAAKPVTNFYANSTNFTTPNRFDSLRFNITANSSAQLSSAIFSWNGTGVWQNISLGTITGLNYNLTTAQSTTVNWGQQVCYKWYANDSYNSWDNSSTYCFNIATQPTLNFLNNSMNKTAPMINESVLFNITLNSSANLDSWIFSWNTSTGWQNISYGTASGINYNISNAIMINVTWGQIVFYKWYANTTYGDMYNSTTYNFTMSSKPSLNFINQTQTPLNPIINQTIIFNVTANSSAQLSAWFFSWNMSGSWTNTTPQNFIGSDPNISLLINSSASWGTTICYRWYANTTYSDWYNSSITCFNMSGTPRINFYANWTNFTTPRRYDYLMFNITANSSATLSTAIFSWNGTGLGWINISLGNISGLTYNLSTTQMLDVNRNINVCYKWYVNDSFNNWGNSSTYCFNVNNSLPTQSSPLLNSTFDSNTSDEDLYCYPQNGYDADGDTITYFYAWFNDTARIINANSPILGKRNFSEGMNLTCQITPNDGIGNGTALNSTKINILKGLTINLMTPENNYVSSTKSMNFYFNASGASNLSLCELVLNTTSVASLNSGLSFDTPINISYEVISDGNYLWSINCTTISGFKTNSTRRNITILSGNLVPNVTLNFPLPNAINYGETATFNCTTTDDGDVASVNFWSNSSGVWQIESSQQYSGFRQTNVTSIFTLTGLADDLSFIWDCEGVDYENKKAFSSSFRNLTIDLQKPNATLTSPVDYWYDNDGNVTLNCTGYDNADIANITLYTNISGVWQNYSTQFFPGNGNRSANASFIVDNLPFGITFMWSCFATDNQSYSNFAFQNYTMTILDEGEPFFARNSGTTNNPWTNPTYATGDINGAYAYRALTSNTRNVYTYNFSGAPTTGLILGTYLSLNWYVNAITVNRLDISYSNNSGTNWYSMNGANWVLGTTTATSILTPTNQSYLIQKGINASQIPNLRLRVHTADNGGAGDIAYVDSLFVRIQRVSPPAYSNILTNTSPIFVNDSVQFNTTWSHKIKLGCYKFYINQSGVWQNTSCVPMTGKIDTSSVNWTINATPGTIVQWYFWANDTFGQTNQTPIQYFISSSHDDAVMPEINSVNVTPLTGPSGTIFNITANITDNIGILLSYAEITFSNGVAINYSMSQVSGGVFWRYILNSTMGGNHSVKVYAFDGGGNIANSSSTMFNVTSYLDAFNRFYSRGENVQITGHGFSASNSVTITIKDPSGATVYSGSSLSNSNGTVSLTWNIPSELVTLLGDYTVALNDSVYDYLNLNSSFLVLKRVDVASAVGGPNAGPVIDPVDTQLYDYDGLNYSIYARNPANNPTFINMTFIDTAPLGYTMDSLKFYFSHRDFDTQQDNTTFEYYNGSTWLTASCSRIRFNATLTTSICDLTPNLVNITDKVNLKLRLNYQPTSTNNNIKLADVEFTGVWANWTVGNSLAVTILSPTNEFQVYTFNDSINNNAYSGEVDATPMPTGPPPLTGTEATIGDYSDLVTDDGQYWQSYTTTNNMNAYQTFYFTINEQVQDIKDVTFVYNGIVTYGTGVPTSTNPGGNNDDFRMWAYNYSSDTYVLGKLVVVTSPIEEYQTLTLSGNISHFINPATNQMNFIILSRVQSGGGMANRVDIFTDYAALEITSIPTISGFEDINVTAVDGDGIANCSYFYTNSTGFRFPDILMSEVFTFYYYNLSNTTDYADGYYNITANCSDTTTQVSDNVSITVRIVNTPPVVTLVSPSNLSNFTGTNNVTFIWNSTTLTNQVSSCDLYKDNILNVSGILSLSGRNTNETIRGIGDGNHTWKVICGLIGGISNTSETRTFYVDTLAPTITLGTPAVNAYMSSSSVNFTFTPNDFFNISTCSLIINNTFVANTSTNITKGVSNRIPYSGFSEGSYNWTVNCTDVHNLTGTVASRKINIDLTNPQINLSYPTPELFIVGSSVQFNFTAYDNMASSLLCNITVNGIVVSSNIAATNGSPTLKTVSVGDGFKYWNVSCSDTSGRANTSDTWNFTIYGDPTLTLLTPKGASFNNGTNINFTYNTGHSTGMKNCTLLIDNILDISTSTVYNYTPNNNIYQNFTLEKNYLWTMLCYANNGFSAQPSNFNFTLDMTSPVITLFAPNDSDLLTNPSIKFNFTVLDNLDTSLTCNLTIDNVISATNRNINVVNNSNKTFTETVVGGTHYWNITCRDDAGNVNVSETRSFTYGDIPNIRLISPANNSYVKENATFVYNVTDQMSILNCSLYINNTFNQINTTVNPGQYNYFYIYNLLDQVLNWSIQCYDADGISNITQNRKLTIDNTAPNITLNHPINDYITSNTTIRFNFTIDDVDTRPLCSLYIDDVINQTFNGSIGVNIRNVSNLSFALHNWSVSCTDNATNTGVSETREFRIANGPTVTLFTPLNDSTIASSTAIFSYYLLNSSGEVNNCSLIINNRTNQTNISSEIPYHDGLTPNNFTVENLNQQILNWSVVCYDVWGIANIPVTRRAHIDWTPPSSVVLNSPTPAEVKSVRNITFTFTPNDNIDDILSCNISVYNSTGLVFNATDLNATNHVAKNQIFNNFQIDQYFWNVSCFDGAFVTYSNTSNFSINGTPTIVLNAPQANSVLAYNNITFNYTPSTIADSFDYCELRIDGVYNASNNSIINAGPNYFTNLTIDEGRHNWTVYCNNSVGNNNTAVTRNLTIDLTNPTAYSIYPDGNLLTNSTILFNISAIDNLDSILQCNITINGTIRASNINVNNGTYNITSISGFNDSFYVWNTTCIDDAGRTNTSQTLNFTVMEPPRITLGNPNGLRTKVQTQTFNFTPSDNSGAIQSCKLILNGVVNQTNSTINNGTVNSITTTLDNGFYNWTVNCTDYSGNEGQATTTRNITIDLYGPSINLTSPYEGQVYNQNFVNFNWTPLDEFGGQITCNLTIDFVTNVSNSNLITNSNQSINKTVFNFTKGWHNYSVTCWDAVNNTNISNTTNFFINSADLYIDNSRLRFNNTNPNMYDNLTIFANVTNIGGVSALNLLVDFWDGMPDIGVYLGNKTIDVAKDQNITTNITWIITPGVHDIWVVLNHDNLTDELNYSNNNATISISVLLANITAPPNMTWTNNPSPKINFTLQDFTNGVINYTKWEDGVSTGTGQVTDNVSKEITLYPFAVQGLHNIFIRANDSLSRTKDSLRLYFMFDNISASANFLTRNNTWFNITTPTISFNLTDSLDDNINYTVYFDNSPINVSNSTVNTTLNYTIGPYAQGPHNFTVETLDNAGNMQNYTLSFYIDTTAPIISGFTPVNNSNFTIRTVTINITATDNLAPFISCNLSLDNQIVRNGIIANGSYLNYTAVNLAEGTHFWNATCYDNASNTVNLETQTFNVYMSPLLTLVNPQNNNWSNNSTNIFSFNVSDETGLENCSVLINGAINATINNAQITNNATNNITTTLSDGIYNWSILCVDNTTWHSINQSINRTIYVDTTPPVITLLSPANNANFTNRTLTLNVSATDNMASQISCNITLDSQIVRSGLINNGSSLSYTAVNLIEGAHFWNATCYDSILNTNTSQTYKFNVFSNPTLSLVNPQNNNWSNNSTNIFSFNVSDETGIENCSVLINGAINATINNAQITNNATNNITTTLSEGVYNWSILCYDNSSFNMMNQSSNRTLYVDLTPPSPVFVTSNNSWVNSLNIWLRFNLSDNMANNISYSLSDDSVLLFSNISSNPVYNILNNITLASSNLVHLISLNATDNAGNKNISFLTVYYDATLPVITLISPLNGNLTFDETVTFNFTLNDTNSPTLTCNLTIDGVVRKNYSAISVPINLNETFYNFSFGNHFWNVTCIDLAGNSITSQTWNFSVPKPDLVITSNNITFSNMTAIENQSLTVFADIYNTGNKDAYNILVRFYSEDPDSGGVQLGADQTITSLLQGENITLNTSWTSRLGLTRIYVVVDPPFTTGGVINESNEANNKAYRTYSVASYHSVSGNMSGNIDMTNAAYTTLYQWNAGNLSGDNVFVADYDSSIDFFRLQSIGRNITNGTEFNDFNDIDVALTSENFTDSINTTFTLNNAPIETRNFTVFRRKINNVPIVNSTNNANFKTGLLWDTSDGNTHYNGTQDLVIITEVNEQKQGYDGIVDFEIKIPALLRQYKGPDMNRVTFYTELK